MGTVYWITGLSGAGKTTVGRLLYEKLHKAKDNVVFFDGDQLRQVFGNDLGYTKEDRFQCAMRYSRICKLLADQGIDVVCCTISMFDQVRKWNRENIKSYQEIYIKVPMDVLRQRNQKGLYSGAVDGKVKDVVGLDLELELPKEPDLEIVNDGMLTFGEILKEIVKHLSLE